jgi:WD40 repeat protein/serine/threonine protein kinase/tetratricopeptide (TPR) repeat protein
MSAQGSKSEVVLALAEEFLQRYRQGERPSLKEYAERHPELAAEIRQVFPAMALMENIALVDESLEGDAAGHGPQPAAPLQQLGDYRLVREVGRGGMGIVYEAEQVSLGRHVALKVLSRRMLLDARQSRRFEREAKAAARLHHTRIVPVFGVGQHDGLPYYVMQLIQGRGLHEVIEELRRLRGVGQVANLPTSERQVGNLPHRDVSAADVARSLLTGDFQPSVGATVEDAGGAANPPAASSEGRPSETSALSSSSVVLPGQSDDSHPARRKKPTYWQRVAQLGVQVAGALEHAHGQGVLHRDIKPSNLLLDLRGTVWVTDFGLAKADDQQDLTHTGDVLGTLRYMPPEAFEGRTDHRGDLYSLGLTLYELLALRPAFEEKDRHRLIKRVTSEEPERLERLNPLVPRDLVTIVHKAVDRDPGQRYTSAADLAAHLQRFLDDEPIHARRISPVERLLRWGRRHRGVAAALSAVALLLVLLAAGALLAAASFRQQEQEQRALAGKNEKLAVEKGQLADEKEGERARAEAASKREAAQGQELRRNLYVAEMNLAGQAAESPSGIDRVGELLTKWPRSQPDLRGWEWYYLSGLCHRDLLTLRGHAGVVLSVAWSPDGARLASASGDGTVRVWDSASGKETLTLRGHGWGVRGVAWNRDGTRLASAGSDRTVRVWDVATGKETRTLHGHAGPVLSVAWSPDGMRLASAGWDATVKVWNAVRSKEPLTLSGHSQGVNSVAWSPDGTRLASASDDGTVKVWEAATGKETLTLRGHGHGVRSVAWSPDGKQLATACHDQSVNVWDAASGKETRALPGHTRLVASVAWSPDGRWLASASEDQTVRVWDAAGGSETRILRGHTNWIFSVAWSPDGKRLVSASDDRTIKVWDAVGGTETPALRGHTGGLHSVAWSTDGLRLASASDDQTARVWDAAGGKDTLTLPGHTSWVVSVAWSPDGKRLASGSSDATVKVWGAADGKETLALRGHTQGVQSVAWSPDGKRLASASEDHMVKVWDAATGKETLTLRGHTQGVVAVAWSPDGMRLASGSWDTTARVWDAASGKETLSFRGHTRPVMAVAWSPDGTRLASASNDQTVKVWDAVAGEGTLTFRGHTSSVWSVAWSPDGTRLASASWDTTVKVWEAATGKECLSLRGHTGRVLSVAWSPDGTRLASAGDDRTILIHDAMIGYVLGRSDRLLPALDRRLAADPRDVKDRELRADIHARLGDWDRAGADIRQYSALSQDRPRWYRTDWWVVGPYPENLAESYAPEDNPNPSQPAAAPDGQAGTPPTRLPWQVVPRDTNGFVDFGALLDHAEHISAYALMRVYSPEKQRVAILLGSDDGVRLWLNGQLVHENPTSHTVLDQDAVPVTLEAGWNTLLAKVVNETEAHVLSLRLSGEPADLAWATISALIERGRRDDAERMLTEVLTEQPDPAPIRAWAERFYRQGGDADAHRGDWTRVAAGYAQLLKLQPDDHWLWYKAAVVQAHLGHLEEYRQLSRDMQERFGATEDPNIAERTGKTGLLLPGATEDRNKLAQLINLAVTKQPDHPDMPWFLMARGLAEYRAGRWADAAGWLEKSLADQPPVYVQASGRILLAMTQHRRGQTEAARATLAQAQRITATQVPTLDKSGGDWHDWLINDLLRREAEALLGGTAPASKK